jgi:hypothetical protein
VFFRGDLSASPAWVFAALAALGIAWVAGIALAIVRAATNRRLSPVGRFCWVGGVLLAWFVAVPVYLCFIERRVLFRLFGVAIVVLTIVVPVRVVDGLVHLHESPPALPPGTRQI